MARPENRKLKLAIFAVCGQAEEIPTSTAITEELPGLGYTAPPGDRQIRRYLAEWKLLQEEEKAPFRIVYWPESFPVLLPWESALIVAPLLADYLSRGKRPVAWLARWFVHVSEIAPEEPYERRLRWATSLAAAEVTEIDRSRIFRRAERLVLGLPLVDEGAIPFAPRGGSWAAFDSIFFGIDMEEDNGTSST